MTGALKFDLGIVGALPNPTLSPPRERGQGIRLVHPQHSAPTPTMAKGPLHLPAADYWLGFDWFHILL